LTADDEIDAALLARTRIVMRLEKLGENDTRSAEAELADAAALERWPSGVTA
jgi:hypothetical protein